MNEYWSWEALLSKEACKNIIHSYYREAEARVARIGHDVVAPDPSTRITRTCWVSPEEHISSILLNRALIANQKAGWNFDVDSIESVQLGKYDVGSHYDWHTDSLINHKENGTQRKISVVVMLSDPSDYEGGALEFNRDEPTAVSNLQGTVHVFPSLAVHRVVPITKGVRYSLAAWCRGPAFR